MFDYCKITRLRLPHIILPHITAHNKLGWRPCLKYDIFIKYDVFTIFYILSRLSGLVWGKKELSHVEDSDQLMGQLRVSKRLKIKSEAKEGLVIARDLHKLSVLFFRGPVLFY